MPLPPLNENLVSAIQKIFNKEQIKSSELYRSIYSRDASYFCFPPQVIIRPFTTDQMIKIIKLIPEFDQPIIFRTGGTSLSGQALGYGVICDLKSGWKDYQVRGEGSKIWFQPGLTCKRLNKILHGYSTHLGPDPSSGAAAMMGGIIANNSSGMHAGIENNPYHLITAAEFILSNGNHYDTSKPEDCRRFAEAESLLCAGLSEIREHIMNNEVLKSKVVSKYKLKNSCGYSMNAFIDFEDPLDIFIHLLCGSEGTLAFIASAEMKTVAYHKH